MGRWLGEEGEVSLQSGRGRKVARGIIPLELGLELKGLRHENAGDFTSTTNIQSSLNNYLPYVVIYKHV